MASDPLSCPGSAPPDAQPAMPRTSKRKWSPNFSSANQMVTIRAGKEAEAKDFIVHKSFACYHSPVLRAAFNSTFVEGETQVYKLEDVDARVVQLLIHWFYHQRLHPECEIEGGNQEVLGTYERVEKEWGVSLQDVALKLWILADKLLMPFLKDDTMNLLTIMREEIRTVPAPLFNYVYENTTPGSALRRYLAWVCIKDTSLEWLAQHPESVPPALLVDVITELREKSVTLPFPECWWFGHSDEDFPSTPVSRHLQRSEED